jgi:hypothetical protein
VLQVTERGPDGRPAEILAVAVGGMYDTSIHGWRAYGFAVQRDVEWAPDGTAQVRNSGPQFP